MRPLSRLTRRFSISADGASALEFAIVAPAFLTCLVGAFYVCEMAFASVCLNYAVESAARCYSVKTTVCTDASSTQTYATSHFVGPKVSPTFVASTATCGHKVTGSINFTLDLGVSKQVLPINASSCAP